MNLINLRVIILKNEGAKFICKFVLPKFSLKINFITSFNFKKIIYFILNIKINMKLIFLQLNCYRNY